MSVQFTPVSDELRPSASHPPSPVLATAPGSAYDAHGRAGPDSPWCICGRPREACVSDAVRHLWHSS